ncbi:MAG TPA: S8 family serine peptidase [Anaerolineales bacterium]|nr:S8 family serine peptidase [Anaerolineales bacterium]
MLRATRPDWDARSGACPECVYEVVKQIEAQKSQVSISADLQIPYPVYSPDETDLLSTPTRVRANPNFSGRGVTMAFLDSGFYPHPDLVRPANRIVAHIDATGSDPIERKRFKTPRVTSWHGLMTACIGTGSGFMSGGLYRGIASGAALVLVKTGSSRTRRISEKDIARALKWVIAHGERHNVRVVNISLGGDHASVGKLTELDALTEEAAARGMAVVCAAGNGGVERIIPPASAPSAITVGGLDDGNSLDRNHFQLWRSNYGRGAFGVPKPDVIAPSVWLAAPLLPKTSTHNEALFLFRLVNATDSELRRILKTDYAKARFKIETLHLPLVDIRRVIRDRMIAQKFVHPHYQHVDGTSMAAPIVSGVVAQMIEANPSLTPAQIKERISTTARPLPGVPRERQGRGTINAARAVAAAMRAPGGPMKGLPISPYLTDQYVSFYLHQRGAKRIALAGSFNLWQPEPMQEIFPGAWQCSIPHLPSGEYRYKFIVDGERWIDDPENANGVGDGYGGYHSVLTIG